MMPQDENSDGLSWEKWENIGFAEMGTLIPGPRPCVAVIRTELTLHGKMTRLRLDFGLYPTPDAAVTVLYQIAEKLR